MSNDLGQALSWDSEISQEQEKLTPGVYDFEVVNVSKDVFNGSDKMAPCPIAVVDLRVTDQMTMKEKLFLSTKAEWRISQFFISIGQKKKGVPFRPNWNAVIGSKGRVKIGTKTYQGNEYLEIKEFMEPGNSPSTPHNNAPSTPPANTGFQMPTFGN